MAIIKGTSGKDILVGSDQNDFIYAGAGDDTIEGGAGNDKMTGEDGNDTFIGGAGADTMAGGAGIDTVDYSNSHAAVTVSLRAGTGSGGDAEGDTLGGIENLIGSNNGQVGDSLTGDSGNNVIDGRIGNDFLFGGDGNDTLIGGMGNDTMSGGAHADTFVFRTVQPGWGSHFVNDGNDVITDFRTGQDVLEFTGNGVNSIEELSIAQVGNDTVITYSSNNTTITLQGVDMHQLQANQAHDFLFS